jgi:YbbR domain-containing protein
MTSDPATVRVIGPESRVRQLAEATTEPVQVRGMRDRVRDVVTVGVSDAAIRLAEPQSATVTVEIWPAPVEREVTGVPLRWRNLASGLRAQISPSVGKVVVRGRREGVASLQPDAIEAFVDLAGLGAGRYNLRVQVEPAESFGVSNIAPTVVEVVIR